MDRQRDEESIQKYKEMRILAKEVVKVKEKAYDELCERLNSEKMPEERRKKVLVPIFKNKSEIQLQQLQRKRYYICNICLETLHDDVQRRSEGVVDLEKAYVRVPRDELWHCVKLTDEIKRESSLTMMFADDIVLCGESQEEVEEEKGR
ncbi:uncharacterized protein [Penaeus vannamei]|uniref:uncharacterized protein n=1 Tax=Penaeus vannamei TaxID=6689 RepID=UPI00387F5380